MPKKVLPALLAACALSACSLFGGDDVGMRYEGSTEAYLNDGIVGRPVAAAREAAGTMPSQYEQMPDGTEVLIWTRANVHRGTGLAISCQERVTAAGGIVRSYSRIGDGC